MPRGGPRPNSGRKKGVPLTKARKQLLARVAKSVNADISPLEVLLATMRDAWNKEDTDRACKLAVDAAPYVHPRLATVKAELTDNRTVSDLTDAELEQIIRSASRSTGNEGAEAGETGSDSLH